MITREQIERLTKAVEGIAVAQLGLTDVAREGLELQKRALAVNEQMVATSEALESSLIDQMTPKNGGRKS